MKGLEIDFSKAERICNSLNELNSECTNINSACKGLDVGTFSFSSGVGSSNANIQNSIKKVADLVSKQRATFVGAIEIYRKAYEEEQANLEKLKDAKEQTGKIVEPITKDSEVTILGSVNNGKLVKIRFEGKEYYVPNTKIDPFTYQKYVAKNKLYQNAGLLTDECLLLSEYYSIDMMRGTYTSHNKMYHTEGAPAPRMKDYVQSPNRGPILKCIYNEVVSGRPMALQVTQVNSWKGDRHWVTVIGFSTDVRSYKDLNADKLLVLDCVDGKIQTLSKSRAEGGHQRDLFAQGGQYLTHIATQTFLDEEVYRN